MDIFELADLDEASAYAAIEQTWRHFPQLRNFYDDDFIRRLVPRRRNLDNFLLLMLVQPGEEFPQKFWTSVIADLDSLADEGAWALFKPKFRHHEHFDLESAKSELSLAAWTKSLGFSVTLEPRVNDRRVCEFSACTAPLTWWEVKSLRDIDIVEEDERIRLEVQHRLRYIPQPYTLSIESGTNLARQNVARAVREIKKQIADYYAAGGSPPRYFESHGLKIAITGVTKRGHGYLGVGEQAYVFGAEQMNRVLSRISSARAQLPSDGAGIVVIDATMARWLDDDDVIDACFGEERLGYVNGKTINVRMPGGAFQERHRTRISAVVYYTRSPSDWNQDFEMVVLHNPFAREPLPHSLLQVEGVRQLRRVNAPGGMFRLEEF